MSNKKPPFKKYFVVDLDGFDVVDQKYFNDIKDINTALSVAVMTYNKLSETLLKDSYKGKNSYVGNMKVTTGLERTLIELNHRFCGLNNLLHSYPLKNQGLRVNRC